MIGHLTVYVVVEGGLSRRIHAVCETAEEAEQTRGQLLATVRRAASRGQGQTSLTIHAMNAVFPGDRYRLVYGQPRSRPSHPLDLPRLHFSKLTHTDAHSEAYLYPDELFIHRKEALAAAAKHNLQQLKGPSEPQDWAIVVEIGEPLWRRYRSECLVLKGFGWEETDLDRPVRVVYPTKDEVSLECVAEQARQGPAKE